MADLTLVRGLFGLRTLHVAVILDVFSRLPLVAEVYAKAPTSADIAALCPSAVKALGAPVCFITDQGVQFTGKAFTRALARKATQPVRPWSVGQPEQAGHGDVFVDVGPVDCVAVS